MATQPIPSARPASGRRQSARPTYRRGPRLTEQHAEAIDLTVISVHDALVHGLTSKAVISIAEWHEYLASTGSLPKDRRLVANRLRTVAAELAVAA